MKKSTLTKKAKSLPGENTALATRFARITPSLSETDRLEAALHMGCSYETIKRYLAGSVKKEAFAKKLLAFLEDRAAANA